MTSIGQLAAMNPDTRARVIKTLSPDARFALAHLASIGAKTATERAVKHLNDGRDQWARESLADAQSRATIAVALTDPKDL